MDDPYLLYENLPYFRSVTIDSLVPESVLKHFASISTDRKFVKYCCDSLHVITLAHCDMDDSIW